MNKIYVAIFFSLIFLFAGCTMPWDPPKSSLLDNIPTTPTPVPIIIENKTIDTLNWTNFFIYCNESKLKIVQIRTNLSLCNQTDNDTINQTPMCIKQNISLCDLTNSTEMINDTNASICNNSLLYGFENISKKFLIDKINLSICEICELDFNQNLSIYLNQSNSTNNSMCDKLGANDTTFNYDRYEFLIDNRSKIRILNFDKNNESNYTYTNTCNTNESLMNNASIENISLNDFVDDTNFIFYCNVSEIINTENKTVEITPPKKEFEIYFFDVGFGDATLIRTKDYAMLIDTGQTGVNSRYGNDTLVEMLKKLNVGIIDTLMISSWEPEKISGVNDILEEYNINEIWHDGQIPTYGKQKEAYESIKRYNFLEIIPITGMKIQRDILEFEFYNPQKEKHNEKNADSIVMSINYNDFCVFFPGEIEHDVEVLVVDRNEIIKECPIYKWRGHGAGWGESSILYDRVGSKNVVISVGQNRQDLPSNTTLERLTIAKKNIYRTDKNGHIYVNITNNSTFNIYTDLSTHKVIENRGKSNISVIMKTLNATDMGKEYLIWKNSEN